MRVAGLSDVQRADLFATPFVSSWAHSARQVDRSSADPALAAAGWASWLLRSFVRVEASKRSYLAVQLDGRIYRSGRLGDRAHLEVPDWVLTRPDRLFPQRLAAAGAALRFPSFLFDEVVSIRRSVFRGPSSETITAGIDVVRTRSALEAMTSRLAPVIPSLDLVSEPEPVSELLQEPVVQSELGGLVRAPVRISVEPSLLARSGRLLSRRLHVWDVEADDGRASAVTPRLTVGSLLKDPLFFPRTEGAAAALVRLVVLARLGRMLGVDTDGAVPPPPPPDGFLRRVVAAPGRRTPEVSPASAAGFCRLHPSAPDAYRALISFASGDTPLTSEDRFAAAHTRVLAAVGRAEDPAQEDAGEVLPLLVDAAGTVSRVTFVRRTAGQEPAV